MTSGARARFSELILPRLDEGYRLARRLLRNATDADDVLQDACLRAFTVIERFEDVNTRAWFLTIVRNACYTWMERNRPKAVVSSEHLGSNDQTLLDVGGTTGEPPPTPESILMVKDEAEAIAEAIDLLPTVLKEAFVLREYHDLSYREIAEISAVPIGTVMSRLARARQHLLTRLEARRQ